MIWVLIFAVFLAFALIKCQRRPGIAIGLLITMYGIETFLQSQSAYVIDHGSYANIAVGFVVFWAVIFSLLRSPFKTKDINSVQLLAYALFGLGVLSFQWSLSPEQFSRWKGEMPHIVTYLVLAPILTREKNVLSDGLRWTVWIGIPVLLLVGFYCQWGNRGILLAKPINSPDGRSITEALPLAVASLASIVGIITLVVDLKKLPFKFLFRLAVLALSIFIAFKTESRGQVIAIIAVSTIIYPISNRATNAKGLLLTMIGFVVFGGIIYLLLQSLDLGRWQQQHVESAVNGRQETWVKLLTYWIERPGMPWLLGLGACSSFAIVDFYPHNLPVEILAELGIVGILLFGAILLTSFNNSTKILAKLNTDPKMRGDSVAIIGLIGVNLALSLKEGSLYGWSPLFLFAICIAQQAIFAKKWNNSSGLRGLFITPKQMLEIQDQQFPQHSRSFRR